MKTEGVAVRAYEVTGWSNGLLTRISRACSKAKYQGKRRAGCKRSGRYTTTYHGSKLRRGGVRQYVQGQGVSHIFVRMSQCCLAGRYVRNFFARNRGQSGALDCRGVCALGVARALADVPQLVTGARFGEAAWAQCARGPGTFSRFRRILSGCLGELNFRVLAARNRDRSGVHDGRGVFALGGHLKQGWLRAPNHRQIGGLSRPS